MSQQSHQTSVVPSDSVGQTAEVSSGGQQSGVDVSNDAASGHDDASEVPTVLDRLRGLYNPRIDENTDRLRKQIRRWPDPFRLFDDRTQEGETVPGESAADSSSASGLTQETAESRSAGMSSDSSESPPESVGAIPALQAAIIEMEKELSEWPRLPSGRPDRVEDWRQRQTDLRLLYMIAGQSAESVRIIDSLPEEEQEFWQSLMLSMNSYREAGEELNRKQQLTESLDHLRMAVRKLQPLSALSIRRTILCDRIDGFGSVSAYPTSSFEPGQRILIYVEPQNFRSELTASGKYRSEFAAVLEFMREGEEEIVESIRIPQMEDLCDVERTDYFQSFELTLPALEGRYLMRIRLRDQLSLQTAEANMEFTVRSSR